MSETSKPHEELTEPDGEFDLPQHILEKYDSCQQVQLIRGYRILQVLKYYPQYKPFFEKPENEKRGMTYYYDLIKNPMWFNEIKRKFFSVEYNWLCEVIADMRLIFENCYYFWGPKSSLTDLCLQMEKLVENQMSLLPKDLKNACTLEETHGKPEDSLVTKVWNRCRNKGKTCSRLMLRTWRRRRISETKKYNLKSKLSTFCKNSKQIIKWERDVLSLPDNLSSISCSQELPQIAVFFQLLQTSFDFTPVCQTELERMISMPQYSSAFQKIMSSILSDDHSSTALKYEELIAKFNEFISKWFGEYENLERDILEVSKNTGIDANFFKIVGDNNPFRAQKYEELPYYQKVIILKAMCDHLIHTQSDIKDVITNADIEKFSSQRIGRDKHGYTYLFFPTFLDFRLYKQKVKDEPYSSQENLTAPRDTSSDHRETCFKRIFPTNCTDCQIVANSTEDVRCLIDELFYSDLENSKKESKLSNIEIIDALQKLLEEIEPKEDECIRLLNDTRIRLFNEWRINSGSYEPEVEDETSDEELNDESDSNDDDDDDDVSVESESKIIKTDHDQEDNTKGEETSEKRAHECETNNENQTNGQKRKKIGRKRKHSSETTSEKSYKNDDIGNDENALNDSFTEEMESFIKTEPQVFEEIEEKAMSDVCVKTEIKEEVQCDEVQSESTISTRRRRSSVPSYNVFNEDFFSDENEVISPEEIYSSEEDSDDEWEVPRKRNKNKNKTKVTKQFKATLKSESSYGDRRKRRYRNTVSSDNSTDTKPPVEELKIKVEEVKSEAIEIFEKTDDNAIQKNNEKPTSKIKVIDLAKLKSINQDEQKKSAKANDFVVQSAPISTSTPMPNVNSLPVIGTCVSQNMNVYSKIQPRIVVRQPVIGNAYTISKNQNIRVLNNSGGRLMNPLNVALSRSPQAIIRTPSVAAGFPNVPSSMVFRRAITTKQIIRAPANVGNKFMGHEVLRKQPMTMYERSIRNVVPLPKIGKNITVVPKVIDKPMQRRPAVREIEGMIGIHSNNGLMQYVVNLANGTHVPLSNEQVQKLREGNRGVLPQKLKIPVPADVAEKIEPCVVIDD